MICRCSWKGWFCQVGSGRVLALHKKQGPFKSQCAEDREEKKNGVQGKEESSPKKRRGSPAEARMLETGARVRVEIQRPQRPLPALVQ